MSAAIVVDASAATCWLIPTQATLAGDAFQKQSAGRTFAAPFCFRGELRGLILRHERRNLLAPRSADADLVLLESRVAIESETDNVVTAARWGALLEIARRERLSIFDAAYLEMAQRLNAELASRDARLINAAVAQGLVVHDLRDPPT